MSKLFPLGEVGDRLVMLALHPIGSAPVFVGLDCTWVKANNLGEVRNGPVVFTLSVMDTATVRVGPGVLGVGRGAGHSCRQ